MVSQSLVDRIREVGRKAEDRWKDAYEGTTYQEHRTGFTLEIPEKRTLEATADYDEGTVHYKIENYKGIKIAEYTLDHPEDGGQIVSIPVDDFLIL
jgi:hypothetical protein